MSAMALPSPHFVDVFYGRGLKSKRDVYEKPVPTFPHPASRMFAAFILRPLPILRKRRNV
jgi:hypothetical protein